MTDHCPTEQYCNAQTYFSVPTFSLKTCHFCLKLFILLNELWQNFHSKIFILDAKVLLNSDRHLYFFLISGVIKESNSSRKVFLAHAELRKYLLFVLLQGIYIYLQHLPLCFGNIMCLLPLTVSFSKAGDSALMSTFVNQVLEQFLAHSKY